MLETYWRRWRRHGVLLSAVAGLCAGGVRAQESVQVSEVEEVAATVTAIDQAQRLVTIRGPEGNELTLKAGPDVRNLAQVEVGDIVRLTYEQAYMASRLDADEEQQIVASSTSGAVRAAPGERPGVAVGTITSVPVTIESIGPDGRTATFVTPDGGLEAIYVQRDESRAFARSLQPGDRVLLTYAEAVALVVEELGD